MRFTPIQTVTVPPPMAYATLQSLPAPCKGLPTFAPQALRLPLVDTNGSAASGSSQRTRVQCATLLSTAGLAIIDLSMPVPGDMALDGASKCAVVAMCPFKGVAVVGTDTR